MDQCEHLNLNTIHDGLQSEGFDCRTAVKMLRIYRDLWMYQMTFILMVVSSKEFVSAADTNLSHRQHKHATHQEKIEWCKKWYEA